MYEFDKSPAERAVLGHVVHAGIVASYPRSGNTRVRQILASEYGLMTGSFYDEDDRSETFKTSVNHCTDVRDGMFYKTHAKATETIDLPTIVVTRDPRYVFQSLHRWYAQDGLEFTPQELILGRHPWGDWSEWVRSWARYARGDTLWLKHGHYQPPDLGQWFAFRESEKKAPSWKLAELRVRDSIMFGPGEYSEATTSEFFGSSLTLLYQRHGSAMTMLGYRR